MRIHFNEREKIRMIQKHTSKAKAGAANILEEKTIWWDDEKSCIMAIEQTLLPTEYKIVMATSKRARQIVDGAEPLVDGNGKKALSIAVEELNNSKIKILGDDED